jgi:hypothetical protein
MVNKEDLRMGVDELNNAMEGDEDEPFNHYGNRLECEVFVTIMVCCIVVVLFILGQQAALYYQTKTTPRFNATHLEFNKNVYLNGTGMPYKSTMRGMYHDKYCDELNTLAWADCKWHKTDLYWECTTDLPGDYKFSHIYVHCHIKDDYVLEKSGYYPTRIYDPTDEFVTYIPNSCYLEYKVALKDPTRVKWVEPSTSDKRSYRMVGCILSMDHVWSAVRTNRLKLDRPSYKKPKCYEAYYKLYRIFKQEMIRRVNNPLHPHNPLVISLMWHIFVAEYNHDTGATASSIVINAIEVLKHKVVRELGYDLVDIPAEVNRITYDDYTHAFAVVSNYIEGTDREIGPPLCSGGTIYKDYKDDDDTHITPQKQEYYTCNDPISCDVDEECIGCEEEESKDNTEISPEDNEWLMQFNGIEVRIVPCSDDNECSTTTVSNVDDHCINGVCTGLSPNCGNDDVVSPCSDTEFCYMDFKDAQVVTCDDETGACTDGTFLFSPLTRFYYICKKIIWTILRYIIPSMIIVATIGIVLVGLWIILDILSQLIGVL